jgi:hypothetical protein
VGENPPNVKWTDDQLSYLPDHLDYMDDEILWDSVTPTSNPPQPRLANGHLLTACQKPPNADITESMHVMLIGLLLIISVGG